LPFACAGALIVFGLLVPQRAALYRTFLGAGGVLLLWCAILYLQARRTGRSFTISFVPRKQHWLQACAQLTVLLYWGWHVRLVYAFLPLIVAQLIFAYAVDSLLTWSRRDTYALGFGPFPVIFSINLFLWFRPEWFYWQFALIALGFAAKELIRWKREGRLVHIFNPSSFPLAVVSLALILTGTSDSTLGSAIAGTQFYPPHMYLVIFLVALPGQLLFGVARMTLAAVLTLYAISLLYFAATGTYLFYDTHIPIAVFLGMHLLFTDPSTSPRTELGRIAFGMLYGIGTAVFYVLLEGLGIPTFYDKLLPVPLMNLLVRRIDHLAVRTQLARLDPARPGQTFSSQRRNLVYVSIWACVFLALSTARGVGDNPAGQSLAFWQQACSDGSERACNYTLSMTGNYCEDGSGWACNEWGILRLESGLDAGSAFARACELGFTPACDNTDRTITDASSLRSPPLLADLPIVLRGTKPPLRERDPAELYSLACKQDWPGACEERNRL
jgi:hypothetical protein